MLERLKHIFKSKKNSRNYSRRCFPIGRQSQETSSSRENGETQTEFVSNHVKSSKYTIFSFLFLNLLEQFRRTANFCYLCIAIIQVWKAWFYFVIFHNWLMMSTHWGHKSPFINILTKLVVTSAITHKKGFPCNSLLTFIVQIINVNINILSHVTNSWGLFTHS